MSSTADKWRNAEGEGWACDKEGMPGWGDDEMMAVRRGLEPLVYTMTVYGINQGANEPL